MNSNLEQRNIDIRDPQLAQTFLYFYLFETWEKILQTISFVNSRDHKRSKRNWSLINSYSNYLDHLTMQLDKSVVPFLLKSLSYRKILFDDYIEAVLGVRNVLDALFGLHEKLDLLSGRVEVQGAYDFIGKLETDSNDGIAKHKSWLQHDLSIALSNKYSFIQNEIGKTLNRRLRESGLESLTSTGREVVLALPKAEVDNPLMWAILVNEITNLMITDYSILEAIKAETKDYSNAKSESRRLYCNWSTEISADLFALRLLGPAYFFSFASMEILRKTPLNLEEHLEPSTRISIIAKSIERSNLKRLIKPLDRKENVFFREDITSLFLDLYFYKKELWSCPEYINRFQTEHSPLKVESEILPNVDLIEDILNRAHAPTTKLNDEKEISSVIDKLLSGRPVSSIQIAPINKRAFLNQLYNAIKYPLLRLDYKDTS
jgi:hypothetical protein